MNHLRLRQASEADIPIIRQLADRIWWAHYPSIISEAQIAYMLGSLYSEEALARQMNEEGQVFWLPEMNGQALGFLAVSQQEPGAYFLHKFYLDTREKGMGAILFQMLLEKCPGLQTMRLRVNRQNFKSVNFYFKIGFRIEFCVDTPFGEGYVMDDFQMIYQPR
jgi:N-acetylglutamate synthase-like GNAT family acetyltransferase